MPRLTQPLKHGGECLIWGGVRVAVPPALSIFLLVGALSALSVNPIDNALGNTPSTPIVPLGPRVDPTGARWERLGMVLDVGAPGSYDSTLAINPFVLKDGATYRIWYRGFDGSRNRIMYAISADGHTWAKQGVAIDVGVPPYFFDSTAAQSVMKEGSVYKMWFGGGLSSGPPGLIGRIYYAISTNAASWSIEAVALDIGPAGSWDDLQVQYPMVTKDAAGTYWMYFAGVSSLTGPTTRIGIATSRDGITFSRVGPDPFLDPGPAGSWDDNGINMPFVFPGSPWVMSYSGGPRSTPSITAIGFATSSDGMTWTKAIDNPEFTANPAGGWDGLGVFSGALVVDAGTTYMYYSGSDGNHARIGLAKEVNPTVGGTAKCVPLTINLRSHGRWITCHPELAAPYAAADIVAVGVRLDSWLSPVLSGEYGWVWGADGGPFLRFDRQRLADRLTVGEHVFLVEGKFVDGISFKLTSETIRIQG